MSATHGFTVEVQHVEDFVLSIEKEKKSVDEMAYNTIAFWTENLQHNVNNLQKKQKYQEIIPSFSRISRISPAICEDVF